jgi:hypothetical protein
MNAWRTTAAGVGLLLLGYQLAGAIPPAPEPGNGTPEPLEVRYARAEVDLAEASLARIEATNKRVNRAISGDVARAYARDLDIAKLQLQVALGGSKKTDFDVWLRRAESAAADAELLWRSAAAANQRTAGAVEPLEVDRLRRVSDLAKLQFERGQSVTSGSAEARLRWQLDFVSGQLDRAMEQLRQNTPNSRVYLFDR